MSDQFSSVVQEIVAVAHGDLARVQALVEQDPTLVNAAWDWGGGDWETPLGAAAHTGSREIAEFLLAHGARLDLFAAAMLGKLAVVKATVEAFPDIVQVRGPHGIPLLDHAKFGGDTAKPVLDYLESLP
jgi:hypothetical protein